MAKAGIIGLVAVVLSLSFAALAQAVPCAERAKFLTIFAEKYKEVPILIGLAANGNVLEVLASEQGSWTIIVTQPSGESCGWASGTAWMKSPLPLKGDTGS